MAGDSRQHVLKLQGVSRHPLPALLHLTRMHTVTITSRPSGVHVVSVMPFVTSLASLPKNSRYQAPPQVS